MGRNNWFEFKQFRIEQQKAAMKVGTDGVLLGAWAPIKDAVRILEIGTGTGLIALMLAQRSEAFIDAVEIDKSAFEEAKFNFKQSGWNKRLMAFHADFRMFSDLKAGSYDLIVSNPPFFVNSLKANNAALSLARHNDMLSFDQLISGSSKLLNSSGRLCVILPLSNLVEFRESARLAGFYLHHQTTVFPRISKLPKRVLFEFGLNSEYPNVDELVILDAIGEYTEGYKTLTSAFYPAF